MTARGVTDETLDTIQKCGIDLHHWLEGFKDTPEVAVAVIPHGSHCPAVLHTFLYSKR